ncbi:MAG: SPOR domain-containing protein [Arenicella sp.]|nr:SPOR domain-containing protein [Arenicella sp.]
MPKKTNAEPEQHAEFDLKHRITGAAVLLFLGVLVLPWLLGPPSEASKVEVAPLSPISSEVEVANIINTVNGSEFDALTNNIEETVYISKITPLDAKGNRDLVQAANNAAASTNARQREQDELNALAEIVKQQNDALEKAASETDAKTTANKQNAEGEPQKMGVAGADQQYAKRERDLQAALALELKSQQQAKDAENGALVKTPVSVGWVVQVGLFTDKSRAIALISELKNKGFSASSSVVDTNRGKKTGTRVWLGPFDKRVAAINEQNRLKSKAGKEGFIRVYP